MKLSFSPEDEVINLLSICETRSTPGRLTSGNPAALARQRKKSCRKPATITGIGFLSNRRLSGKSEEYRHQLFTNEKASRQTFTDRLATCQRIISSSNPAK
jgi:hypothetical protein